jgi:hypothetical protein
MGKMKQYTLDNEKELEDAHTENLANFYDIQNLWHPDYGHVLVNGELTENGKKYFEDQRKKYQK